MHHLHCVNQHLKNELDNAKRLVGYLQNELRISHEELNKQKWLKKCIRNEMLRLMTAGEIHQRNCQRTVNELIRRFNLEQTQCLKLQKMYLEKFYRQELLKLVQKKDCQLHLHFTQHLKKNALKLQQKSTTTKFIGDKKHCLQITKLDTNFKRQLLRMFIQLKRKKSPEQIYNRIHSILTNVFEVYPKKAFQSINHHQQIARTVTKNQQNTDTNDKEIQLFPHSSYRDSPEEEAITMREVGEIQHESNSHVFVKQHYGGGSFLETLTEVENEDEFSKAGGILVNNNKNSADDIVLRTHHQRRNTQRSLENLVFGANTVECSIDDDDNEQFSRFGYSSLPAINISQSRSIQIGNSINNNPNRVNKCPNCCIILNHKNEKILSLEKTVQQLRDELKECRDQNELLEFRLLEIQEFGLVGQIDEFERLKNEGNKPVDELIETTNGNSESNYGAEVTSEEVMTQYQSHHTNVTESRSSSSECSESLSFQESGIFDSQYTEESSSSSTTSGHHHTLSSPRRESSDFSQELGILTSQIENLIFRLSNNASNATDTKKETSKSKENISAGQSKSKTRSTSGNKHVGKVAGKGKQSDLKDTSLELQSCRKHVQELEKRITPYLNSTYVNNLEDKITLLIQENRKLEEERSEMEEAENDSRNQCQRLEEVLRQVKDRNIILQRELSREKTFKEQLTFQLQEMEERNNFVLSQYNGVESISQSYEQRNFELEESQIELKSTIQFLVQFWPFFYFARFIWILWKSTEESSGWKKDDLLTIDHQRQLLRSLTFSTTSSESASLNLSSLDLQVRKHKLLELPSAQPCSKKHRRTEKESSCGKGKFGDSVKEIDAMICSEGITTTNYKERKGSVNMNRENEEVSDINKYRKVFEIEKLELVEKYERKLVEMKKVMSVEYENSQKELEQLNGKWDSLIKEIEQCLATLNPLYPKTAEPCSAPTKVKQDDRTCGENVIDTVHFKQATMKGTSKIKGLVATRIQSLFPNEWRAAVGNCEENCPISVTSSPPTEDQPKKVLKNEDIAKYLIQKLVQQFTLQREKFVNRENTLLSQIDQFKHKRPSKEVGINVSLFNENQMNSDSKIEDEQKNYITHLVEENKRLQHILSDQEKAWNKLNEIEEENEKLNSELTAARHLKKKLDESFSTEKVLRNKVEELEVAEFQWKEKMLKREAKERKLSQEIQQLKDDCEYFHSKSCQLQNDFDKQKEEIDKQKSETQQINNKLKACQEILMKREQGFEKTEHTLQSQIAQLQSHVKVLQQELADSECTNGMLREEVLYLEQTLRTALEKNTHSEDTMKILACQMQEKVNSLDQLKRECCNISRDEKYGAAAINDLDVFARNEGGLIGVVREIKEIQQILQSCNRCGNAVKMLTEVSEQLNTLTLMLGGYQDNTCIFMNTEEESNLLTRCESEEHITPTTSASSSSIQQNGERQDYLIFSSCPELMEENKVLQSRLIELQTELDIKTREVQRLQGSISTLGVELCQLEKEFAARKKDLKESHFNELLWWKLRCQEKNDLIQLLAKRIAHLSVTDSYGYFMEGILKEIKRVRDESYSNVHCLKSAEETAPQDCNSLLNYFNNERRRLTDLLNSCNDSESFHPDCSNVPNFSSDLPESVDFRVLRRISEDSLLVSWTIPESSGLVDGYEISVNGNIFLRIPKPNRFKAILFGLNMNEPIELSLKCKGAHNTMQESCITFIA